MKKWPQKKGLTAKICFFDENCHTTDVGRRTSCIALQDFFIASTVSTDRERPCGRSRKDELRSVVTMTTGKKIKRIRLLRGLTQRELGIAAGLHPYTADTRISQYEIDDRVPKKELLEKIAIALGVSVLSLQPFVAGTSDADIMLCLMDIEDEWGSRMLLDSSKQGKSGIFFESPRISKILDEWLSKRKSVEEGTLSPDDCLAWKLDVIRDMVENP